MRACPSGELAWQRPMDESGCASTVLNRLLCAGMGCHAATLWRGRGDVGGLLIVLKSNRLHWLVKSGNSVVEEVMVLGLKSMEVLLKQMEVLF